MTAAAVTAAPSRELLASFARDRLALGALVVLVTLATLLVSNWAVQAQDDPDATLCVVDSESAIGTGDCWGPDNVFTDLQDALIASDSIEGSVEIWVASGTYYPTSEATSLPKSSARRSSPSPIL